MEVLSWIAEPLRIWIEGGAWADIEASNGFRMLVFALCWIVPTTLFAIGFRVDSWRELPVAAFLGFSREDLADDTSWVERARDLDKDGAPDF